MARPLLLALLVVAAGCAPAGRASPEAGGTPGGAAGLSEERARAFLRPVPQLGWPDGAEGAAGLYLADAVPLDALEAAFAGPPAGRARLARVYLRAGDVSGSAVGEAEAGGVAQAVAEVRRQLRDQAARASEPAPRRAFLTAGLDTVGLAAFRATPDLWPRAASVVARDRDARLALQAADDGRPTVVAVVAEGTRGQIEAVGRRLGAEAYADLRAAKAAGARPIFVAGAAGAGARAEAERAARERRLFARIDAADPALLDSLYHAARSALAPRPHDL